METIFYKCYVGEDAEKATTLTLPELKKVLGFYYQEENVEAVAQLLQEIGSLRTSPFVFFCTEAFYNERVKTQ